MGSVKEQMQDNFGLLVNFACPNPTCASHIQDEVEDTVFDFSAERASDGEGYEETTLTCDECGNEYLVAVRASGVGKEVFLLEYPDTDVEFVDNTFSDDYDHYLFDYKPDDPYGVYKWTTKELTGLFHGSNIKDGSHEAFQRMVYLQHVIAFEAYLSDRLIKIVTNDPAKLVALVGATEALREAAPKLIEIAKDPNYVVNATKEYLQRFSFHDLPRVAAFYKAVLKINLFENADQEKALLTMIKNRHDLVHRSGRDNDGKEIDITFHNVFDIQNLLESVVARIEDAYTAQRFFAPDKRAEEIKNLA